MYTVTKQGKFLMNDVTQYAECVLYKMHDFRCMDALKQTYKSQMGLFADHISRSGSFLIVALDGVDGMDALGFLLCTGSTDGVYVHLVDVSEEYQRKGIASKMFAFLENTIQESNKYGKTAFAKYPIMLHCVGSNIAGRALYKKAGFHTVCRVPNVYDMYEWQMVMRKNAPGKNN